MLGWKPIDALSESTLVEGDGPAFSMFQMSIQTRLKCFGACACIGFVLSLLGACLLLTGSLISFAFVYGCGTIVMLISTGFIIGFGFQLKQMFNLVRIVATIILLVCIALIFVGAFVIRSGLLCIILVIIQFFAFTWYSLSYIPYAREGVKRSFQSLI